MSNAYYRIYLREVFNLAKTMVIKSTLAAEAINDELQATGHTVSEDPQTWKYYQNLAGEYHATDQMMTVRSMDTLETINFTKDNLEIHRSTADEYRFGTRWYRDLVNRFPEQEMLILGILDPIDKNRAIDARDGEILDWDEQLVEPQEQELIDRLQEWIDAFLRRWSVDAYKITDELYPAAKLGVIFSHLPLEIINIREAMRKTNQAHSYHIREYLASHNHLDRFIDELTLKQMLFLYRNIRYIQRNPGHQKTFASLLYYLITDAGLPLAAYEIRHNDAFMLDDANLLPDIDLHRRQLNDNRSDGQSLNRTMNEVLARQNSVAPGNRDLTVEQRERMKRDLQHSQFNQLPTKVFESAILDTTNAAPFRIEDTLLFHWPYLAFRGFYQAAVTLTDPISGEITQLDMREAFIAYMYAFNKARGIILDTIPAFSPLYVQREPQPTIEELREVTTSTYVSDSQLYDLLFSMPTLETLVSIDAYREYIEKLNQAQNRQRDFYMSVENATQRAMLEAATARMYRIYPITELEGQNFESYLETIGLPLHLVTANDNDLIATQIIEDATQLDVNVSSPLERRQRNALEVMGVLSSYSVHYLQNINAETFWILDQVAARLEPVSVDQRERRYYDINRIDLIEVGDQPHIEHNLEYESVMPDIMESIREEAREDVNLQVDFTIIQDIKSDIAIDIHGLDLITMNDEDVSQLYVMTPDLVQPPNDAIVTASVILEATTHQPIVDTSGRAYRQWQITTSDDPYFNTPTIVFDYNRNQATFHVEGRVPAVITDGTGNHDGDNQGAIAQTHNGQGSLSFDGSSHVTIGDAHDIAATDTVLIEITTATTNTNDDNTAISKVAQGAVYDGWTIRKKTDNEYEFRVGDGTNQQIAAFGTNLSDDQFYTLSALIHRPTNTIRTYVDGAFQNSGDISGIGAIDSGEPLRIGSSDGQSFWIGYLTQARIWNWGDDPPSLSTIEDQINTLYDADLIGTETALVGHWPLVSQTLNPDTSYYWRCRDYTNEGRYSFWMRPANFTTTPL